jgi:hypothetical protein
MRNLFILALLCLTALGLADETYMGLYLQGNKIGYSSYIERPEILNGRELKRSDSKMVMTAGLMGAEMRIQVDTTTWADAAGAPVKMLFVMESAGRTQRVSAAYGPTEVLVDVENSGTKSQKRLALPKDGSIMDDPLAWVLSSKAPIGQGKSFYVLDPTTVSFVRNTVTVRGASRAAVRGEEFDATLIEISDPRANTKIYVSAKGDLIKVEAPMGIEMIPETKEAALGPQPATGKATDLAALTAIRPDKVISSPGTLSQLRLRISGHDLGRVPSDGHQTTRREGDAWIINVHPPRLSANLKTTIAQASNGRGAWLKPDLHMPSGDPKFRTLARTIIGTEKSAIKAALRIKSHVHKLMRPNASIGVLRDANDVLKTKEGVCRDYAILTGTLMRAAGIPARLASGLVSWDGLFYYHAWVEVWDGRQWVGIDSTTANEQISAAHVKLASGTVEQTFTFTFLDKVKVQVLDAKRN